MVQTTSSRIIEMEIRYWWLFLLTGIVLIGIGIWIFASPTAAYITLSVLFAVSMLVTGVLETIFAITVKKTLAGWGWTFAGGLLDIVIGFYLLSYPSITLIALPFILGFWLMFRGFSAIGFALDMRAHKENFWGVLLIMAILASLLGLMVLAVPAFGVINIILWSALAFLSAGIFRVTLAFRLKKLMPSVWR